MPYQLNLPPQLAAAAPTLASDQRFRRMLRAGRIWRTPRMVLWAAQRLGYSWGDDPAVARAAIRAGWRGAGRPWRIVVAIAAVLRGRWQARRRHVPCWAIPDDTPRRWGPTETILRPSYGVSPAGPPPAAAEPSSGLPPLAPRAPGRD